LFLVKAAQTSTVRDIFTEKIDIVEGCGEKLLVRAELIACLEWLIYLAPFKAPHEGPRGVTPRTSTPSTTA
jgi:hypothetical protein